MKLLPLVTAVLASLAIATAVQAEQAPSDREVKSATDQSATTGGQGTAARKGHDAATGQHQDPTTGGMAAREGAMDHDHDGTMDDRGMDDHATMSGKAGGDGLAVATLMAVNDHEIKSAEIALDKKVSAAVSQYAKMLRDEHTKNQTRTRQLVQSENVKPMETAEVVAMKQKSEQEREMLRKLDGPAFEAAYIDAMVKGHADALSKIDNTLLPSASDPQLAQHLRDTRGHVANHLEQAKRLDNNAQAAR